MKRIITTILIIFLLVTIFASKTNAQKNTSSIIVSGMMTRFEPNIGENMLEPDSYNDLVDPGVELLYQFSFSPKFSLSTGVNYQFGRTSSTTNFTIDRFRFGETSIPLIFKATIISERNHSLFISAGFSFGKLIHLSWERPGSGSGWFKYIFFERDEYYSENYFFNDILFNVGYSYKVSPRNEFAVSPYIKYRLIDNWMGNYRKSYYYGIQISYQLNFIKR